MPLIDFIFTIGIFLSLFNFFLLQRKRNKSLPDRILSFWMLVVGIHLSSTYLNINGYWEVYPHLIGITVPFPFFYGTLLYLYIYYSVNNSQFRKQDYLHFSPVVLSYIYMFKFYFFYSEEEKRLVDRGIIHDFDLFSSFLVISIIISGILYSVLAYRLLKKYKLLIEDNFSNTDRIQLNWLHSFIMGVGAVFVTVTIVVVSRDLFKISYPFNPDFIFYAMIVFGILSLGYSGIRHQNIFIDNVVVVPEEKLKPAYQRSSLKEEAATEKYKVLTASMINLKPYLDPNLTLNTLATQLDVSPHHLSQIINQFENQNFNDYINKYRVEEFIERASKGSHFSYLALAMDSGFNSKSTFNAAFKKHKGVTPSQYMHTLSKEA